MTKREAAGYMTVERPTANGHLEPCSPSQTRAVQHSSNGGSRWPGSSRCSHPPETPTLRVADPEGTASVGLGPWARLGHKAERGVDVRDEAWPLAANTRRRAMARS